MTAVSHVQTTVVAVAGLGVEVEDDVVGGDVVRGVDLTVGVLPVTTLAGGSAAAEKSSRRSGQTVITHGHGGLRGRQEINYI